VRGIVPRDGVPGGCVSTTATTARPGQGLSAGGIVGRPDEVAALLRFVVDPTRQPAAALIEGEAGIGKTTLVDGLIEEARDRGYATLVCRPARSEMELAHLGLMEILAGLDEEVVRALPSPQRSVLEVILRRAEPTGPFDRLSLSVAVLAALRSVASMRPILVAVDDIQWLDHPTAQVLSFALRRLQDTWARLALVRRGAGGWPFELDRALPPDRLERLSLGPMDASGLSRTLRTRLGWAAPWPTVLRIAELSGGNPFYALEIGRAWAGAGAGAGATDGFDERMPGSLTDLVRARLAALPAASQELLELV
jgi:predicted ATPase